MDIGSLICIVSFWGGERISTNKNGPSDTVALRSVLLTHFPTAGKQLVQLGLQVVLCVGNSHHQHIMLITNNQQLRLITSHQNKVLFTIHHSIISLITNHHMLLSTNHQKGHNHQSPPIFKANHLSPFSKTRQSPITKML